MFNSIFRKQFILYLGTVLVTFAIFATAMSQAFRNYFVNQKENMLEAQAGKLARIITQHYELGGGVFSTSMLASRLREQIIIIHEFLDVSFLFVNTDFLITLATNDIDSHMHATLSLPELNPVLDGTTVMLQGKLSNIFSTTMMTVAYPVTVYGNVVGAVILNTSMPEIQRNISDVLTIMLFCLLASAIFAFTLIYLSSRTISKPLLQMNEAAKVIASGNFEKRLGMASKDEIGQLGQSFNNMAESLYQQDKLRQEFITNMSHDIRSPLTSMRGFLQAILDGTIPPEKQERYISIVLDETDRLSKLANDILDLNKIQQPNIALTRTDFDINELIRKTVVMLESRMREKNLSMTLSFADEINIVNADYEKITRVLYNLLDNAFKFTPKDGTVGIETAVNLGKLVVVVSDNGPGISEENQKWVFDRFYKADSSRGEDKSGSGLGLSIVKAFIKAHDENITIESIPGKGARFIFSLPCRDKGL